ncbi:MAG: TetR/AcrR family transcriptional regulator [Burkholderiaceae bacterium]|nr:TetR/AcrR family transcriptional regulator [Burkholderiaceae bacterium]
MSLQTPPRTAVNLPRTRMDGGRALQKGQQTKAAIVDAALSLATHIGLEGLSIGALADITGMSKSGVFAHFGSREELQISVIREYHSRFEQEVFYPAISSVRGVKRLTAMFDHWMKRTSVEIDSGCIYISGAVEFDDRSGPVRDALAGSVLTWLAAMRRAIEQCKELGEVRADTHAEQMLFEIHGLILALHYEARFLQMPGSISRAVQGFHNILARVSTTAVAPAVGVSADPGKAPVNAPENAPAVTRKASVSKRAAGTAAASALSAAPLAPSSAPAAAPQRRKVSTRSQSTPSKE